MNVLGTIIIYAALLALFSGGDAGIISKRFYESELRTSLTLRAREFS